jgi:ATP-dependent Clp protease ATP-binding subunit ClpC
MLERFTENALHVAAKARKEAQALGHNYIGTEHVLAALVEVREMPKGYLPTVAYRALTALDVTRDKVVAAIEKLEGRGNHPAEGHIPFTPRAKKVFNLALREAMQLGHNYVGTEHILLAIVREGEGVAVQILASSTLALTDLNLIRREVIQALSTPYFVPAKKKPRSGVLVGPVVLSSPQERRKLTTRQRGGHHPLDCHPKQRPSLA